MLSQQLCGKKETLNIYGIVLLFVLLNFSISSYNNIVNFLI